MLNMSPDKIKNNKALEFGLLAQTHSSSSVLIKNTVRFNSPRAERWMGLGTHSACAKWIIYDLCCSRNYASCLEDKTYDNLIQRWSPTVDDS